MQTVTLSVDKGAIELDGYADNATLGDLIDALEQARRHPGLRTATCHLCGECCGDLVPLFGIDIDPLARRLGLDHVGLCESILTLPERPDLDERRSAIGAMARDSGLDRTSAALVYEYNSAEPLTFRRHATGICSLQAQLLCTIYGDHPTACRFYLCTMADRLSVLYENVVRQGVWHSYAVMGWIDETDIAHNPFVGARSASDVALADFDVDLSSALEALFFYF